jgi:hypothetical protein
MESGPAMTEVKSRKSDLKIPAFASEAEGSEVVV